MFVTVHFTSKFCPSMHHFSFQKLDFTWLQISNVVIMYSFFLGHYDQDWWTWFNIQLSDQVSLFFLQWSS